MDTYRVVCPLCRAVIVSSTKSGTFADVGIAIRAAHGHLKHSCEKGQFYKPRAIMAMAENSVEIVKGAA